jgi:thioredoxin reductase (NADPH)
MTEATLPQPATSPPAEPSRPDAAFPALSEHQVARVATHGHRRSVHAGELLLEAGALNVPFFVVVDGRIEIIEHRPDGEAVLVTHGPGQFTGEINMLSGRRSFFSMRAAEDGEVIEVEREQLLAMVQSDAELSEIFMKAFILRRLKLLARGFSDVVLIGSSHSAGTLRIREFLSRNGHPYSSIDLDRDAGVQDLLDRFKVSAAEVPVLICRGDVVLRNPTNREIADCLGMNETIDAAQVRDLVIVGAGPSGLAAAVYAASEGLDVLVLEAMAPGGQAGSSSRIENYLGFPTGISGQELAGRAYTQAEKFGTQVMVARSATRLACDHGTAYTLEIDGGTRIRARTIIIASGAEYRKLDIENLARFEGSGVYYGATFIEAQLCDGDDVIVVGGGNSAGQAAVFLAQTARRVHMLVRSTGLAETMSRYLIRRIEESPEIELRTETEITALSGDGHLERVYWRNRATGVIQERDIGHVFVMTGASPSTGWLSGCVALDERGFIKTGVDLSAEELRAAQWPLARLPHLLETSRPGVFAVGDVRAGNVKRVASAVGEGSIAVSFVHQALRE